MLRLYTILFLTLVINQNSSSQTELTSEDVYQNYIQLGDVEERFQYIDHLDSHERPAIDSLYLAMVSDVVRDKLTKGDTSDVLGLSLSLIKFYQHNYSGTDRSKKVYEDIKNFLDINPASVEAAEIFFEMGVVYSVDSDMYASIDLFKQASESYFNLGEKYVQEYGTSCLYMAESYYSIGDFGEALQNYEKAENVFKAVSDTTSYLWAQYGKLVMFSSLDLYEEVNKVLPDLMTMADESGSVAVSFAMYSVLMEGARKVKDYPKAVKYSLKMVEMCEEVNNPYYCLHAYYCVASSYLSYSHQDSAQYYFDAYKERFQSGARGRDDNIRMNLLLIENLILNKEFQNAEEVFLNKLAGEIESMDLNLKIRAMELRYTLDTAAQDYKTALQNLIAVTDLIDSLNHEVLKNQFSYYQTTFETNKRKQRIAEQESLIAQVELNNKQERYFWFSILGGVVFISLMIYFMRERNQARKNRKLQENYSRSLLIAQEDERKRISRELHDGVGQSLALAKNKVNIRSDSKTNDLVALALQEIRKVSHGLHPYVLERLGLTEAIKQLVYEAEIDGDIFFDTNIDNVDGILPEVHELNIYRIVQEALSNMVKHAETEAAKLSMKKTPKEIKITIIDHGKGFNINNIKENMKKGIGIKTMQERMEISRGKLVINSAENAGTQILLSIPIP